MPIVDRSRTRPCVKVPTMGIIARVPPMAANLHIGSRFSSGQTRPMTTAPSAAAAAAAIQTPSGPNIMVSSAGKGVVAPANSMGRRCGSTTVRNPTGSLIGLTYSAELWTPKPRTDQPTRYTRPAPTIGAAPIWGSFRLCPVLGPAAHSLLDRTVDVMQRRLDAYGDGPNRFGLIHADLRLGNLLIHSGNVRVIDFDDSGTSWFGYDLGAALSFMEDRDDVPALVGAWVRGYRRNAALSAAEETELTTFIILRRLVLLGWIGSRAESDLAQEMQDGFAQGTCAIAEKYLQQFG